MRLGTYMTNTHAMSWTRLLYIHDLDSTVLNYSAVQCSTLYSTVRYSPPVQYSTIQYSTVQYSIVQYSTLISNSGTYCDIPYSLQPSGYLDL